MSNIRSLHGIKLSPAALLASVYDDVAKSKAFVIGYMDDDGVAYTRWSEMPAMSLLFITKLIDIDATEEVKRIQKVIND